MDHATAGPPQELLRSLGRGTTAFTWRRGTAASPATLSCSLGHRTQPRQQERLSWCLTCLAPATWKCAALCVQLACMLATPETLAACSTCARCVAMRSARRAWHAADCVGPLYALLQCFQEHAECFTGGGCPRDLIPDEVTRLCFEHMRCSMNACDGEAGAASAAVAASVLAAATGLALHLAAHAGL